MTSHAAPDGSAPTRHLLLAAAAREFARAGYRAATVQAIAAEAGFTPPTLYAHFGTKQGLFEALAEGLLEDLMLLVQRTLPEGLSLAQRLELQTRGLLELAERQRDLFSLFILRPYDLPDLGPERSDDQFLTQYWEGLFAQYADELGDRTPREAALVFEGVLYAFVKNWVASEEDAIAHRTRRIVELILDGLAARRPERGEA